MLPPAVAVLVVEDDPQVGDFLRIALQEMRFTVRLARSGLEALAVYRHQQQSIALVLLDVLMPGMGGPQTLAELRKVNPALVCCFMSGSTGKYSKQDLLDLGAAAYLSKPFTSLDEMAKILRRLVHQD